LSDLKRLQELKKAYYLVNKRIESLFRAEKALKDVGRIGALFVATSGVIDTARPDWVTVSAPTTEIPDKTREGALIITTGFTDLFKATTPTAVQFSPAIKYEVETPVSTSFAVEETVAPTLSLTKPATEFEMLIEPEVGISSAVEPSIELQFDFDVGFRVSPTVSPMVVAVVSPPVTPRVSKPTPPPKVPKIPPFGRGRGERAIRRYSRWGAWAKKLSTFSFKVGDINRKLASFNKAFRGFKL